jgi:hypothetical protein
MKLCTCHTEDIGDGTPCPNNGLPFNWDDEAAKAAADAAGVVFTGKIYCGPCGHEITDMVDAPADYPHPPDTFPPPPEPPPDENASV